MKNLFFISGTMGVGKTFISQKLSKSLPNSVFLDGDTCWDSNPFIVNEETKSIVVDNICYMLNKFLASKSYENIVFCWVMHKREIMNSILNRLDLSNTVLHNISLVCSNETLTKNFASDKNKDKRTESKLLESIRRMPLYYELGTKIIDKTNKSSDEVIKEIIDGANLPKDKKRLNK